MANQNPTKNPSKWFPTKSLLKLISLHLLCRPKKPSPTTTEKPQDSFRKMFRRLDSDGDGRISTKELHSFLSIDNAVALDGEGLIDYDKFVRLVGGDADGREREDDVRRAFEMFEGKEAAGCITPKGLMAVLGRLGEEATEEDCAAMIRVYDLDGNGVLDYQEFLRMMS